MPIVDLQVFENGQILKRKYSLLDRSIEFVKASSLNFVEIDV